MSLQKLILSAAACLLFINIGDDKAFADGTEKPGWVDQQDHFRKRAADLVSQMTLDEKVKIYNMSSLAIPRLKIPEHHWWSEALHGVGRNGKATQFPQSICMASTFNPSLIKEMTDAIGDEARAKHHQKAGRTKLYQGLTIWSPTVNLGRDPRWGRNEETYGEDPVLTALIAEGFVRGLQGDHEKYIKAVSTVKHFIANNTEYNRTSVRPFIAEKTLRDYYMVPFRHAVQNAHVQSIMTAYNGINDVACGMNKWLLTDVLKDEWGFKGTVVTDVGVPGFLISRHKVVKDSTEAFQAIVRAGVDVECNGPPLRKNLKLAVEKGMIKETELDRALVQNLTTRLQLGQMDSKSDNPYTKIPFSVVGSSEHCAIARKIAQQGIVMLKNDTVGEKKLLPFDSKRFKKIIVAGPYANIAQLGGYSGTPTHKPVSPYEGIKAAAGSGVQVELKLKGDDFVAIPSANLMSESGDGMVNGLKGEYFAGISCIGSPKAVRVDKNVDFAWPKPVENIDPDIPQPQFAVRWTGDLVPDATGEYIIAGRCDDGVKIWLDGRLIVNDWSNHGVRRKTSGKMRLEAGKKYKIKMEYYDNAKIAEAHLEWLPPYKEDTQNLAGDSTLLVYVCGFNMHMADEFKDLLNLNLPDEQLKELIHLYSMYPNTVVVFNGGTCVTGDWVYDNIPAVMHAWYSGQEGGHALADLVMGKVSPSGRLPQTCIRDTSLLPHIDDYEISKGRTYMYMTNNVRYAFGHGQSYCDFSYSKMNLSKKNCRPDDAILVTADVTNKGNMDADEVVQLYVRQIGKENAPLQQLKAFQRLTVKKGETVTVSISLPVRRLEQWDVRQKAYVVEQGVYELRLGASSSDIRLVDRIEVAK